MDRTRIEHDLIGDRKVPADALYGVHTLRALENFTISGIPISRYSDLVSALACVKHAAAVANHELGLLNRQCSTAIAQACEEIRNGHHHDQFVVDVIQGGAGTSTNMNANEVIANRALEILGYQRGQYEHLHPLEHVNLSQSTNDVYPSALKVALHFAVARLRHAMDALSIEFHAKATEFADVLKMGRTQLQDAVPMTLGQEFATFAVMVEEDSARLEEALVLIREINLGGTAIGTGLNAHPDYAARVCAELRRITGLELSTATDLVEATQDVGALVQLSGVLKRTAVKLSKICNDLRLLSSGPRVGLGEIILPTVQAGSSIMPGKVNPVIPEVVNQIAFEVIGNDITITMAAEAGQLQLNAFEPIIAHSLFKSLNHLTAGCDVLRRLCVPGIRANVAYLRSNVARSIGMVTALTPYIGYEAATQLAADALSSGQAVSELAVSQGLVSPDKLASILDPVTLAHASRRSAARETM
ncbi:aspartate ammonia-lyase [Nocardia sp. NPDC059246]|uniref:aspartate ammonia-lyase n=1 Tax=unclassified Nocardia TaxID=2637762 RepID=UPI0036AA166A